MCQRVNYALIDFLNNVQIPGPQPLIWHYFNQKICQQLVETFYHKSVHVLPEDPFVNVYKQNMLEAINDNIASKRI